MARCRVRVYICIRGTPERPAICGRGGPNFASSIFRISLFEAECSREIPVVGQHSGPYHRKEERRELRFSRTGPGNISFRKITGSVNRLPMYKTNIVKRALYLGGPALRASGIMRVLHCSSIPFLSFVRCVRLATGTGQERTPREKGGKEKERKKQRRWETGLACIET